MYQFKKETNPIRIIREKLKLSRRDLACLGNIGYATLSNIENGYPKNIKIATAAKIVAIIGALAPNIWDKMIDGSTLQEMYAHWRNADEKEENMF